MTIELSIVGCLGPPLIPAGTEVLMLVMITRKLLWWRRLRAVRVWQEAARREAAEHSAAVRRILDQAERAA